MTRAAIAIATGLALIATLPTAPANAQSPRTFVSAAGSDSNPCSFAAPCRHFQAAVNATSAGGEVDALDPAGYGPITISQAITIEGQGWSYIAPPAGGNGITINAVSGDVVIHGVSVNGAGIAGGTNGIVFNTGSSLSIENCVIRHMTSDGINFFPSATSSLTVSNTVASNNGDTGIYVFPGSSTLLNPVSAEFNHVVTNNNGNHGVLVDGRNTVEQGNLKTTVSDSIAARNGKVGFFALTTGPTAGEVNVTLMLVGSVAANNLYGLDASGGNTKIHVANSTVAGNTNGWITENGGVVFSYGDNYIDDNVFNQDAPPPSSRK